MVWKELEIDNLPPDILTGGYEFGFQLDNTEKDQITLSQYPDPIVIITRIYKRSDIYYYRKPEPKAPTHEEIMEPKYWKDDNGDWMTVTGYKPRLESYAVSNSVNSKNKRYFTGRESADIPPEA